ncbi:hypothetical protein Trco_007227 [Trichoderma cornu-damae]|uniref:Uncharacterized protein n=1 Tax=Trichoderma cornu-damae TaxID=654480 RepID=A0A9P8QFN4_9HYPO|nr:hypothetical protein Trco_007227 [Trichoderma cornu-damae]
MPSLDIMQQSQSHVQRPDVGSKSKAKLAKAAPDQSSDSSTFGLGSEPDIIEIYDEEEPTASHALAEESIQVDVVNKGASQVGYDEIEAKNIGRRRKSNMYPTACVADLDMDIAEDDALSPDKLRAQLERLYAAIVVTVVALWKHVVRLRSWRDIKRTVLFSVVWSVAWLFDMLIPISIAFLMESITYPPARILCFPPAPPSVVDPKTKTGGVQKWPSGVIASDSSITGAPEELKGEGVEQEAQNFVNSIALVAISTSAGKHPQVDPHDDNTAPDQTNMTEDISNDKGATYGKEANKEHDRTKKPVSNDYLYLRLGPFMHMISAVLADTWERFGNALIPTPPLPAEQPRDTLSACLTVPMPPPPSSDERPTPNIDFEAAGQVDYNIP